MKKVFGFCQKKGSVILVVVCILVALMILLASFFKSTTSRVHTTKKLGDTMLARELANSLAILSNHYLRKVELNKKDSELYKLLSRPIDKFDSGEGIIKKADLKDYFGEIYTTLLDKSGLNKIELKELKWVIYKGDFKSLMIDGKDSPYPREKKGLVRIYTKLSYLLPGTKSPITEDYLFYSEIIIAANLLPVLSKFSFYVENAFNNQTIYDEDDLNTYFNVVDTTEGGELNPGSPRPWVINNGNNAAFEDYKDYIADKRGLIYLGGATHKSPIILGIARGFTNVTQGDYGEDFHFFKNGASGYWKTLEEWGKTNESNENGVTAILQAEIGLCNDKTENYNKWQENFGVGYDKITRYNSIFRLYGTDKDISPTLVYGYVNSMCGSVRAFKKGFIDSSGKTTWKINKLVFLDKDEDYFNAIGIGYGEGEEKDFEGMGAYLEKKDSLMAFYMSYSMKFGESKADELGREVYLNEYATKVTNSRYNKDFTYYIAKEKGKAPADQQYPLEFCKDLIKGDLEKLCKNQEDDKVFLSVPNAERTAEFRNIYSESVTLEKLDNFLDTEKIGLTDSANSSRIGYSCILDDSSNNDIEEYFKVKGFLKNKDLDLNSWVYIDNKNGKEVKLNTLNIINHGGIILSEGDIVISGNIKSSNNAHFTLIALKGNIIVERSVETIDASLIVGGGQLKLEGDEKDHKLMIKGNIAMKNIASNNNKVDYSKMKRGLFLKYNTDLSAIPCFPNKYIVEESKSELPLLMYDLKENTKMLD